MIIPVFTLQDVVIFGGAFAAALVAFSLLGGESHRSRLSRRVAKLKSRKVSKPKTAQDALSLRKKTGDKRPALIEMLVRPLPDLQTLTNRLQRAGSSLDAKQFLFRSILVCFICAGLAAMLGKNPLLGFFLGVIVGFWLPFKLLSFKINRQQKEFLRLFPEGIDLIVRGLRSGLPVTESINLVAKEVSAPVGPVFQHVSDIMRLGVPMEKALQEMAQKLSNTEFNFFTTSIILQRETGGNLAEILNNLSEVIRKRYMMKMKIKAMTSEARASAMIVGALPFLVTGAVMFMSPGFIDPLFTDYRGNIGLAIAVGMLTFGVWSMQRMAKFEI